MSYRGGHGPLAQAVMSWRGMQAAVDLGGGQWLSFATALPETGPVISTNLLLAVAASAGLIALLTALAARRITAPIRFLSDAAQRDWAGMSRRRRCRRPGRWKFAARRRRSTRCRSVCGG